VVWRRSAFGYAAELFELFENLILPLPTLIMKDSSRNPKLADEIIENNISRSYGRFVSCWKGLAKSCEVVGDDQEILIASGAYI
jgi:hypothetical protein